MSWVISAHQGCGPVVGWNAGRSRRGGLLCGGRVAALACSSPPLAAPRVKTGVIREPIKAVFAIAGGAGHEACGAFLRPGRHGVRAPATASNIGFGAVVAHVRCRGPHRARPTSTVESRRTALQT